MTKGNRIIKLNKEIDEINDKSWFVTTPLPNGKTVLTRGDRFNKSVFILDWSGDEIDDWHIPFSIKCEFYKNRG